MEIKKNINEIDWWGYGNEYYFEEGLWKAWVSQSSIGVVFLEDAMKRGKRVAEVRISGSWNILDELREKKVSVYQLIQEIYRRKEEFQNIAEGLGEYKSQSEEVLGVSASISWEKGVRVFSPFAKFKPFKREPKNWNITNVIKGLMTGQIHDVVIKGKYSDDYAWDAATNYSEGVHVDSMDMAQKLVESRGGWRTSKDSRNKISICCHTFDIREAVVDSFDAVSTMKKVLADG